MLMVRSLEWYPRKTIQVAFFHEQQTHSEWNFSNRNFKHRRCQLCTLAVTLFDSALVNGYLINIH
jgi:hypothetical protein